MKTIMIVEDDTSIRQELVSLLENSFYKPIVLENFKDAKKEILTVSPDLLLLDINIPYMNGELLLKDLRKESNLPIIMVTSRSSESDEVLSMSYGADDYITKPYNPNILLLRIAAVLKRVGESSEIQKYKELEIHMPKGIIKNKEKEVILTKNEMIILNYLLTHKKRIVTRDELMTDLWNNDEYINDNALTVNISRLRAKLKEVGYENVIETRKKAGYILL
ncbi:MAG: response regulator transcription factor [Bacilli bacterium]|nr:response regulator transcription factor [Bacilli bacterium]